MTAFTVITATDAFTFDAHYIAYVEFGDIITFYAADYTYHKIFTASPIVAITDADGTVHFAF